MPSATVLDPFVSDYPRTSFHMDHLSSYPFQSQSPSNMLTSIHHDALEKKSQNMTECVPVPSSEHVAEIVGRQGCKIKALRTKTNTYIKTPVRGDEPVFIITGRKEDVFVAKKEILSAAEHFSQIRAARKQQNSTSSSSNSSISSGSNSNLHLNNLILPSQQTTIQVRVPYRVVGLVVGPKGATIKRIQQTTNTYIITPGRDKEPVFEIAGLPENVEQAKLEIESHIAARTGHPSSSSGHQSPVEDTDEQQKWMKTKFTHHLSLPLNSINGTDEYQDGKSHMSMRSISQSSYFPYEENSLINQSFEFPSSLDLIHEQNVVDTNGFDSVWSNLSLLSLKTS